MKLQESIEVEFNEFGIRKEFFNKELSNGCTVDFTLYSCSKDNNFRIHVYGMQVFNNEGRYMTLTDREYVDLVVEITNKTKWIYDNRKK